MGSWDEYCELWTGNKECHRGEQKFRKATKRASNDSGRQFLPPDGIRIQTLSDFEALFGEDTMTEITMQDGDTVRFASLRETAHQEFLSAQEATVDELQKNRAGKTLTALARQHAERKGCSFSEALHAVAKICPGEMKEYLGYQLPG